MTAKIRGRRMAVGLAADNGGVTAGMTAGVMAGETSGGRVRTRRDGGGREARRGEREGEM